MNMTANVAEMPVSAPVKNVAAKPMGETLRWSVQRELWENRSIYLAPVSIAGLVLFGFAISIIRNPKVLAFLAAMDPESQRATLMIPFGFTAMLVMMTSTLVAVFYTLDAMYGERRDRSILFWKSLPVSDTTTVLSKAIIPLVVLPTVTFVVVLVTQFIMLVLGSLLMVVRGLNAGILWTRLPLFQMEVALAYGLITAVLWHAPIYGWLLLVSSWAKRATLLWAILPWFAVFILEKIAFHTSYVGELVRYRFAGNFALAFGGSGDVRRVGGAMPLGDITPGAFFACPWLWVGLAVAVGLFVLVVRMRRYREPI
jgi:ABC-2 type transport system permease protein